jgi:hypothetical protein
MKHLSAPAYSRRTLIALRGHDLPLAHHATQNGTPCYAAAFGALPINASPMTNQLQLPPPYPYHILTTQRGRDLPLTHRTTQNGTPRNAAAFGASPFNLSPMTNQLQLPPPYHHRALTTSCGRDLPLALKPVKPALPVMRPRWGHQPLALETSELWAIAAVPDLATTTTRATLPASIDEIRCSPLYCWPSATHSDCPGLLHEGDTSRFYPRLKRYQRRYQGGTERYQQAVPGDTRRYPHPEKAVPAQYHPIRWYRPGITFSPVPPRRYPVPLFKQGDTEAIRAAGTARIGIALTVLTPIIANAAKRMNRPCPVREYQPAAQRPDAADGETRHAVALRLYLLPITRLGKNNNQEELLPDYLPT